MSKTRTVIIGMALATILACAAAYGVFLNSRGVAAQGLTPTLLNGGFEGGFSQWPGIPEWIVPEQWTPYALEGNPPEAIDQGPLARPEYKEANVSGDAHRVRSGSKAAQWFTFYRVHQAGLYQRVKVTPGQWYQVSAWAQGWCSNVDTPTDISPGEMYVSIGIDPDGQTGAARRGVVWTYWHRLTSSYVQLTTAPVQAKSDYITVYIETWNKYRYKHNDAYIDDVTLEAVDLGGVCPTPEPCPTQQPCPTCVPGGDCDNVTIEDVRSVIREELDRTHWGSVP